MKQNMKLSDNELLAFCDLLALVTRSAVPLAEGFYLAKEDAKGSPLYDLYDSLILSIDQGDSLSDALKKTKVFPDYVIAMAALGEQTGTLDKISQTLSKYYERKINVQATIRSALSYPILMLFVLFCVVLIIIMKIMPIFEQVYQQLGAAMSGFALGLIRLSHFIDQYAIPLLMILLCFIVFTFFMVRSETFTNKIRTISRRIPFLHNLYRDLWAARIANSLSMCISCGMDFYSCFQITADLVDDPQLKEQIMDSTSDLQNGIPFIDIILSFQLFDQFDNHMLKISAETGSLDSTLQTIADRTNDRIEHRVNMLLSIVEPTLVIVLCMVVGLIVLGIMSPLIGILSSIG